MKISDRALIFAIKAHEGVSRKDDKDKPFVIHPMITGEILKSSGFDDAVVSAGYLHDVPEDTTYTTDDIARIFGGDIASLVLTATLINNDLPWKKKKLQKIKQCRDLPVRNKAVIVADKISNLEDIKSHSLKNGMINFDNHGGDFEDQKWYYRNILSSLEYGVDDPLLNLLLDRLYNNINEVFFTDFLNASVLEKSNHNRKIEAEINELQLLKNLIVSPKPFIIEFANQNEYKNNNLVNIFEDFFDVNNFKIKVSSSEDFINCSNTININDRDSLIFAELELGFLSQVLENQNILLLDNSVFNKFIIIQRLIKRNQISSNDFKLYIDYFKESVNYVLLNFPNKEKEISIDMITRFINLMKVYQINIDDNLDLEDSSHRIFESLLPIMRKEYVKELKLVLQKKKNSF